MAGSAHKFRTPLQKILTRFSKALNGPVSFTNKNRFADLSLPGLPYKDFTRAGIPAVWDILRLLESDRILLYHHPEYELLPMVGSLVGMMSAQTLHITPAFYKKASSDLPMTMSITPGRLGKRTLTTISKVSEKSSGELFMVCERQFAYIDPETKQVASLPEGVCQNYSECEAKGLPPFHIPVPVRPQTVYEYSCKVPHSDTDMLYHTNQSVYIKYCMDCATSGQRSGFLQHFNEDLLGIPVSSVAIFYKAESFMDDLLHIAMWQDPEEADKLHFQVHKDDNQTVACTISFHSQEFSAKL